VCPISWIIIAVIVERRVILLSTVVMADVVMFPEVVGDPVFAMLVEPPV
jgi:hypothetical protein